MTDRNLENTIVELKEMKAMKDEVITEIERLESELKAETERRKTADLSVGIHRLRYKPITSNRFDSKAFKAVHADLYAAFTKPSQSMRFTVQ